MSFVWPAGLALGALLPLIVILYFLKLRRVPKVVSSTFLLQRAINEYRVNRPFQRFQNQLLLWVQLLVLGLLILALARPYVQAPREQTGVHIYLLDHSASMNTREDGGTRLDLAKRFLREAIRGKRGSDRFTIIGFSDRALVAVPLTSDAEALLKGLDLVGPTERPTRLDEAWQTALSVARQFDASDIYLVSDGGFGPLGALTQANATVHYVPVGKTLDNVGIVHLEARQGTGDRQEREIYGRLFNRRPHPSGARVELFLNDRLVDARDVTVGAGETKGVVFRRRAQEEGVAEVRLAREDAFPADNRAWVSLRAADPARVLLVGEENVFLREALVNDPEVEFTHLTPGAYAPLQGRLPPSDLVVFDGVAPQALPRGAALCLGTVPPVEGFDAGAVAEHPRLVKWDGEHPLTRFLNFSTLNVSKLVTGGQPPWMRTLLVSDRGPVISAGERGGTRLVVVRFPLLESDWPLRVSFPLFVSNLVRWAKEGDAPPSEGFLRPGQPLAVAVPPEGREGTLVFPDGSERRLAAGGERRLVVGETERPGVYRARWDGRRREAVHVVNLLEARESDVAVPDAVTMGGERLKGKDERALVRREFTRYLLLAALAILLLEWALYQFHR